MVKRPSLLPLRQRGFTIVELLIVIIVIAILAAIVLVTYSSVTQRAHAAAAQSAASDLSKLLAISASTNGTYPSDLTTVNGGGPMPTGDGSTYAYHPGSGNSSYCATITNANVSYMISDTSTTPTAGACPGDGVNGVPPITNYALDPDATTATNFGCSGSGVAPMTSTIDTVQVHHGTTSLKRAISGTGQACGDAKVPSQALKLTAGSKFSWSFWVYSTRAGNILLYVDGSKVSDGSYAGCGSSLGSVNVPANTWTQAIGLCTPSVDMYVGQAGGYNLSVQSGDTVWFDQFMLTPGSSMPNYADGNTTGWIWNGTANNATSTGPPQ